MAVASLTFLVFARSLGAGFLDLDDPAFVVANPHIRAFTLENLRWMFGAHWVIWFPAVWVSYALDFALWGGAPAGFHLTNVLLHALGAVLVFRLLEVLLENGGAPQAGRRAAAAFGALLFALHPLRVESVSWVSERSDVLAGVFALAAALAWLDERPGAALGFHALGAMAKPTVVPLPLVLGLLDVMGLGRRRAAPRAEAVRLAPMLALSLAAGALAAAGQGRAGAARGWEGFGIGARLATASWNFFHGAWKTLWPAALTGFDQMPRVLDPSEARFLWAGAAVAGATAAAWSLRRRLPAAAAAWCAYLLLLAPTAGFLKVGNHLTADRYTYLAAIGFAGLAAAGARRLFAGAPRSRWAAAGLLAALAALTWVRQRDWLDPESFWTAVARADPRGSTARLVLARRRVRDGRPDLAEPLLREAVAIDPGDGGPHNALGLLLAGQGRDQEAVAEYRSALDAAPDHPMTRYNLAAALARAGRRREAAAYLREELELLRRAPPDGVMREMGSAPDAARTEALLRRLSEGRD